MKKYKKISYVLLVLFVILLGFTIYKVYGKNNEATDEKSKSLSEIKNLQKKMENLFNELNNIKMENYKISSTKIEDENSETSGSESGNSSSGSTSGESSGNSEGESGGSGESSGSSSGSNGGSGNSNKSSSKDNKKYEIEDVGILTNTDDINWDNLKTEIEGTYNQLPAITLDLYKTNIEQQTILSFNAEYDKLTKSIKEENKEEALKELSTLYEYMPKFIENCSNDNTEKIISKTKNNIFQAYSKLEKEDWQGITENLNIATQEFTQLLTNMQNSTSQYNINKAYVMINEIKNAVNLKDQEIFLIKYKNLLEELENI